MNEVLGALQHLENIKTAAKPISHPLKLVNEIVVGIYAQISDLEKELAQGVQNKLEEKHQTEADEAFRELYENVHDIKMKAAQSEAIIEHILSNPENSQFAKSQLLKASATVNYMLALISATEDLEEEMAKPSYSYTNIGRLLKIINAQFAGLVKYNFVAKVDSMKTKVNKIKQTLKRKIFQSFREIGQFMDGMNQNPPPEPSEQLTRRESGGTQNASSSHGSDRSSMRITESDRIIESLRDAHLVVAELGEEVLVDLLDEIVQLQLLPYESKGRFGGPLFSLDKEAMDRRWSGLRKLVFATESRMSDICPPNWMLPHRIYLEFSTRTAKHLRHLLAIEQEKYKSSMNMLNNAISQGRELGLNSSAAQSVSDVAGAVEAQEYVALLVSTLKSCLAIEHEMAQRFEDASMKLSGGTTYEEEVLQKLDYNKFCSEVFDDYMEPYVRLERRNLDETLKNLINEDTPSLPVLHHSNSNKELDKKTAKPRMSIMGGKDKDKTPEPAPVIEQPAAPLDYSAFPSAAKLFEVIRSSMKRIVPLTTGSPFLSLTNEYREVIQAYAEAIKNFSPTGTITTALTTGKASRPKITPEEEAVLCRVINTAEYCADVIPKMEETIKSKIHFKFVGDVNMSPQVDNFHDAMSFANNILVQGTIEKLDTHLRTLRKTQWEKLENVGDESPYVQPMTRVINEVIPRIRDVLPRPCFKHYCTSFMSEFLDSLLGIIMGLRKITPTAAEQLQLDLTAIKTSMMKLHHLGLPPNAPLRKEMPIPGPYTNIATAKLKQIETVLKLVCIEDDTQFEEMFYIMNPEGDHSDMLAIRMLKEGAGVLSTGVDAVVDGSTALTNVTIGGTKAVIGGSVNAARGAAAATGNAVSSIGTGTKNALNKMKGFGSLGIDKMKNLAHVGKQTPQKAAAHVAAETNGEAEQEEEEPAPPPPKPKERAVGRYG